MHAPRPPSPRPSRPPSPPPLPQAEPPRRRDVSLRARMARAPGSALEDAGMEVDQRQSLRDRHGWRGTPVVLFLSGISMVNAAMTTQLALERFDDRGDPVLGHRRRRGSRTSTSATSSWRTAGGSTSTSSWRARPPTASHRDRRSGWGRSSRPLGMMFTARPERAVRARRGARGRGSGSRRTPGPARARRGASTEGIALPACNAEGACLSERAAAGRRRAAAASPARPSWTTPDLRDWAFETFEARVLDMESAAVAQVAYANEVPFLAIRSLSDLAGGGEGENEMGTFLSLAADNSAAGGARDPGRDGVAARSPARRRAGGSGLDA